MAIFNSYVSLPEGNKHFYWEGFYVEVQAESQKSRQATRAQNYLKKCHRK